MLLVLLLACPAAPPSAEPQAQAPPIEGGPVEPEVTLADPPPGPPARGSSPEDLLGDQDRRLEELQRRLEAVDAEVEGGATRTEEQASPAE